MAVMKASVNQLVTQNLISLPPSITTANSRAKVLSAGAANDGFNYYLLNHGGIQILVKEANLQTIS